MSFIFGVLYIFVLCLFIFIDLTLNIHYLLLSIFPVIGFLLFYAFMHFLDKKNQFKEEFSQLENKIFNFCILLINLVFYSLLYAIINS